MNNRGVTSTGRWPFKRDQKGEPSGCLTLKFKEDGLVVLKWFSLIYELPWGETPPNDFLGMFPDLFLTNR